MRVAPVAGRGLAPKERETVNASFYDARDPENIHLFDATWDALPVIGDSLILDSIEDGEPWESTWEVINRVWIARPIVRIGEGDPIRGCFYMQITIRECPDALPEL
jgi:hypothetical protein